MTCRQRENHGDTRDGDTRTPDNRRALATGNATIATAAALELPRVPLADALALVLLYYRAGDGRFERAALRWHARACAEIPAISLASAAAALQALATLSGDRSHGIGILAEILDALGAYPPGAV